MKKLVTVLMLLLAVNFLAVAGGVGWLWNSKHLDRERVMAIKQLLFPPPATQPAEQVAKVPDATTQPTLRLEELLAKQTGHTATEQIDFMQRTFDAQMAELDRKQRELSDLKAQTDLAQEKLVRDHAALLADRSTLDTQAKQAAAQASDQGFQDSLTLYKSMSSKQVKTIFMGLDDATVMNYLRTMEPRTASKIIKEFKSPDETTRIQKILEDIRRSQPTTSTAAAAP